MAKVRFKRPMSMDASDGFEGGLRDASPDRVAFADGRVAITYDGNFALAGGEVVGGTAEKLKARLDGDTWYKVKAVEVDFASHSATWEEGGHRAALRSLLDGDDRIIGSGFGDTILGFGGDDKLKGKDGDDELRGGDGRDKLKGDDGNDTLFGGADRDKLKGGDGEDFLYGGADDDRMKGGDGDDVLEGEDGDDRMDGGAGADVFVFDLDDGTDTIRDFEAGVDRVALTRDAGRDDVTLVREDGNAILTIGNTEVTLRDADDFDLDRDLFVLA